jgi:hypothetical protein
MFNMWKRHKLWPWQWMTNGKIYYEHIMALDVMNSWYQDVRNMKKQEQQPQQPKEVNN